VAFTFSFRQKKTTASAIRAGNYRYLITGGLPRQACAFCICNHVLPVCWRI